MIFLRSILFNVAFYISLIGLMILGLPMTFQGRHAALEMARRWGRSSLWLLDKICNLKVEFRGLDNIPKGALIIAPKHQSILETFALTLAFDDFTYIVKRELTWIPLFGWYLSATQQLAIDRSKGGSALAQAAARAREILPQGRQIFIFPEGTRRAPGAAPRYKYGVTHLYAETGAVCLPVALNAGLFWPRRSFIRRPGVIVIEFLPPIAPGLDKTAFASLLQERIETATNQLIAEALARDPSLRANMATASDEKNE